MNLHEHQAKELLAGLGVPTSTGQVAFAPEEAVEAAHNMIDKGTTLLVLKAQIHAGGRGKGVVYDPESGDARQYGDKDLRGVKVLPLDGLENPLHEVWEIANGMLGGRLVTVQTGEEGKIINRMLVADGVDIAKEYYCSILLDRASSKNIIMVSTEGGVDIETVAEETPEKIHTVPIDPATGVTAADAAKLCDALELSDGTLVAIEAAPEPLAAYEGPRPPLRKHVAACPRRYRRLLASTRPGITGLATVMVFFVIQVALLFHARSVVSAAAQDGVRAAQVENATAADAQSAASQILGGSTALLNNASIAVDQSGEFVTVTVTAVVTPVVFGMSGPVTASASGVIERFRPQSER